MLFQHQPNKFSCISTAFAMILEIPIDVVLKELGHTGEELISESEHRGHPIAELTYFCFKRGFYVIEFQTICHFINEKKEIFEIRPSYNINEIIYLNQGVLTGTTPSGKVHAVAWDRMQIFDPNGTIYSLTNKDDSYNFNIDNFYLIGKI